MNIIETNIIYENPLPQLRSRQSFFPSLCQRQDGVLAAVFAMGISLCPIGSPGRDSTKRQPQGKDSFVT